ncbi:MAG TPA: hypothetical protein VJQ82_06835 [Terriglobales bacterium]|jgi:hypothetical protein|nr:hypothetical protein [Terriglobales bacterium]
MSEIDTQRSKLMAALDEQVEADKNFDAITQDIIDSHPSSSLAPPTSPVLPPAPRLHHFEPLTFDPAQPREGETELEKKADAPDAPSLPRPPPAPPLLPQAFEDRYAKGWRDACEFIRPEQREFQRRYILARQKIASLDRWMKWLPVICFCCTLFGFALGWSVANLTKSRPLHAAQKVEVVPKL